MAESDGPAQRQAIRSQLHRIFEHLRTGMTSDDHALRPSEVIHDLAGQGEFDGHVEFQDYPGTERTLQTIRVMFPEDRVQEHGADEEEIEHFRSLREEMIAELTRLRQILMRDDFKDEADLLPPEERLVYDAFLKFFNTCPVCGRQNHQNYLARFWFSVDPVTVEMKQMAIRLMNELDPDQENYPRTIVAGIACCECFALIFADAREAEQAADEDLH